jgi:hypothetical protein
MTRRHENAEIKDVVEGVHILAVDVAVWLYV